MQPAVPYADDLAARPIPGHVTLEMLRALDHAYVEAFLSGRWWIFDATCLVPGQGLVRIGVGRDGADTWVESRHAAA